MMNDSAPPLRFEGFPVRRGTRCQSGARPWSKKSTAAHRRITDLEFEHENREHGAMSPRNPPLEPVSSCPR